MINDTTKYFIEKAVEDELHHILHKEPLFNSDHEAYAVLLEAFEEMEDEMYKVVGKRVEIWDSIKDCDKESTRSNKAGMLRAVKGLLDKAVQVTAILEKFSVREGETK